MTIKKQWMLVLVLTAVISIAINSAILGSLINRYFVDYTNENYAVHFSQIVDFSSKALLDDNYTKEQLEVQLSTHLSEPITKIQIFDAQGNLIAGVADRWDRMGPMMSNRMMDGVRGSFTEEVDIAEIKVGERVLGTLNVVRYSSVGDTLGTRMFQNALLMNSLLALGIVLVLVLILGSILSKKMSKDLMNTANLATGMDLGEGNRFKPSKVKEIRIIQQSLEALQSKLKLKQTSRKRLVDELVHQTRTPLTILRTHLEGIEDGVIAMTPNEIRTCEDQIDNITHIINNMSGMIDAEKEIDQVIPESFELQPLLKQIIGGLYTQFERKGLELILMNTEAVTLFTDKYKLSQSIYNVLTNAYKFTAPGGRVSLGYAFEGDQLTIQVEDTGIGISPEDVSRLFEVYFRGDNVKGISGEGIGLYVVKENLNKIGGDIRVETEPGKGSRFILNVPGKLR